MGYMRRRTSPLLLWCTDSPRRECRGVRVNFKELDQEVNSSEFCLVVLLKVIVFVAYPRTDAEHPPLQVSTPFPMDKSQCLPFHRCLHRP